MKALRVAVIVAASPGSLLAASAATAEPIFRYCMIGTPNMPRDCTFTTLQQCQVTASAGVGFCEENPAYVARQKATPIPARR